MRYKEVFLLATFLVCFASFASAEIIVSQPESVYNIGDELSASVTLRPVNPTNDFLLISLVCGSGSVELYRNSINLASGEERVVGLTTTFGNNLIGSAVGTCELQAEYGSESRSSLPFDLSRTVDVDASFDKNLYLPGDSVSLEGTAFRKNGEPVEGFVEVVFLDNNGTLSGRVQNGVFRMNFSVADNSAPGAHNVRIRVYERDNTGELSNEGIIEKSFEVKQVLKRLSVDTNTEAISPETSLTYTFKAFDQADNEMLQDVSFVIYSSSNEQIVSKIGRTGEQNSFDILSNYAPGYWKIEVRTGAITERKLFYLNEFEKIDVVFEEQRVVITNVGNVKYQKAVEVKIGDKAQIVQVDLDVGKSKKYKLVAPDANYDVIVSDGKNIFNAFSIPLTGKVIAVDEDNGGVFDTKIWLFLIFIVGAAILVYSTGKIRRRISFRRGSKVSEMPVNKTRLVKVDSPAYDSPVSTKVAPVASTASVGSGSTGNKKDAVVVAVRTSDTNTPEARNAIDKIRSVARSSGAHAKSDSTGLLLYYPKKTNDISEDIIVANALKNMESVLKEHNFKHKNKIDFGIGASLGEIIIENKSGVASITALGNTAVSAKKIAGVAQNEALVSDSFRRRVLNKVKADKVSEYWRINKISDSGEKHKDFLDSFTKRN